MSNNLDLNDLELPPYFDAARTVDSITLYYDCRHRWWTKLWRDWIQLRWHPASHVLLHSPLYSAFRRDQASATFAFDADTVRVRLIDDGFLDEQ